MFFGAVLKPESGYLFDEKEVEKGDKLTITNAVLATGDRADLFVRKDNKQYLAAVLTKEKPHLVLNISFSVLDKAELKVKNGGTVHLMGTYDNQVEPDQLESPEYNGADTSYGKAQLRNQLPESEEDDDQDDDEGQEEEEKPVPSKKVKPNHPAQQHHTKQPQKKNEAESKPMQSHPQKQQQHAQNQNAKAQQKEYKQQGNQQNQQKPQQQQNKQNNNLGSQSHQSNTGKPQGGQNHQGQKQKNK